jgi:hypothetical protein
MKKEVKKKTLKFAPNVLLHPLKTAQRFEVGCKQLLAAFTKKMLYCTYGGSPFRDAKTFFGYCRSLRDICHLSWASTSTGARRRQPADPERIHFLPHGRSQARRLSSDLGVAIHVKSATALAPPTNFSSALRQLLSYFSGDQ